MGEDDARRPVLTALRRLRHLAVQASVPASSFSDFNVADPGLAGFSSPGEGIDDVLVRGAVTTDVTVWARDRRTVGGVVLSDHAPVDCVVELSA